MYRHARTDAAEHYRSWSWLRRWPFEVMEWSGLCSHNPAWKGCRDMLLSEEAMKIKNEMKRQTNKQQTRESRQRRQNAIDDLSEDEREEAIESARAEHRV